MMDRVDVTLRVTKTHHAERDVYDRLNPRKRQRVPPRRLWRQRQSHHRLCAFSTLILTFLYQHAEP
jgi:hypothetical protein